MKKVRKIILRTFLILVLSVCLASWYLNNIFLPQKVKLWTVGLLKEKTNRQVTLEEIRYNIFKGIVLKEVTIFEEDGKQEFLTAKEIYFKFSLLPLFGKKLIITNLSITSPELSVVRFKPNDWNFSDIITWENINPRTKFTVLISRAVISDGQLSFKDLTEKPSFERKIEAINGEMYLALPASMHFKFSSKIQNRPMTIQSRGNYNFLSKSLTVNLNTQNIALTDYAAYYQDILPVQLNQGQTDLQLDFSLTKDKLMRLYGVCSIKNLALSKDALEASGNLVITTDLSYNLNDRKSLKYKGNTRFDNFQIEGLPLIKSITDINGEVTIDKNILSTRDLKLSPYGIPVALSGEIKNFRNPGLNLTATSEVDLSKVKQSLPAQLKDKLKEINISGKASLSMNINGGIRKPRLSGKVTLSEVSCKTTFLAEDLKNINGNFQFENNALSTSDLTLYYKDTGYKLTASLIDLNKPDKGPDIEFNLTSENLSLLGELAVRDNNISFSTTGGRYFNSSFNLTGLLVDWTEPTLDIQANIEMELGDLEKALPFDYSEKILPKLSLEGKLKLDIEAKGKWNQPKDWSASISGKSNQVILKKIRFNNLLLDIKMGNQKISLVKLTTSPYKGTLSSTASIDLSSDQPYWRANLELVNINLRDLAGDSGLKWQDISGNLTGQATLEGHGGTPESIIGKGWLEVGEGEFWRLPLFVEMANILYFPNLTKVLFNKGFTSFRIANKSISTSDLSLTGEGLNLLAKGSIDFDGNLDFSITTELAKGLTEQAPKVGKIASMIMSDLWNYALELRLEGTAKKPKYSIISRFLPKL